MYTRLLTFHHEHSPIRRYPVGEEFEDECLFRCHCSDRFEVECRQRCPTLPTWTPVNCHLIKDPKDACCNILACEHPRLLKNNANNKTDNFGLSRAVSTLRAHPASAQGCEYNGRKWAKDGKNNFRLKTNLSCSDEVHDSRTERTILKGRQLTCLNHNKFILLRESLGSTIRHVICMHMDEISNL